MRFLGKILVVWVVLTILANPLRMASVRFGFPNVFVPMREILLYLMVMVAIPRSELLKRPRVGYFLVVVVAFVSVYLGVSGFEDKHFEGVFYLRLYLIPLLFCFVFCVWKDHATDDSVLVFCRLLLVANLCVVVSAIAIHVALEVQPRLVGMVFGTDRLAFSWYIAGGVLRMGLPFASPNNLGTYLSLMSLLIFPLLVCPNEIAPRKHLLLLAVLNFSGMLLTFSRSSLLTFVLGASVFALLPGVLNRKTAFKLVLAAALCAILLVVGILVVNDIKGGAVDKWLQMNASFGDPSMQGHYHSVFDALNRMDEYFLYGFERGTVGPKAEMFVVKFENVENSTLGVLFDMGVPCGAIYFFLVFMALEMGYWGRFQWPVAFAFFVNVQLLPYVFSPELVAYFFCVYVLLGALQQGGMLKMPVGFRGKTSSTQCSRYGDGEAVKTAVA